MDRAEKVLQDLVNTWKIPFISASMARGVVPDSSPFCANAARSLALAKADTILVLGNGLNWQLHFGEPPKWSTGATFVLIDGQISSRDKKVARMAIETSVQQAVTHLLHSKETVDSDAWGPWRQELESKVSSAKAKLSIKLAKTIYPLNYHTALRVIRDEIAGIQPAPVVVSEGANTMDQARILLEPVDSPRCRLDAGAWGTMGIGLGSAIAAAVTTDRLVVAVEGDSAFGFSGMEMETICRYKLPIIVIVFNNGGIYGGDRRPEALCQAARAGLEHAGYANDPAPTSFVPHATYEALSTAFGGKGSHVKTAEQLQDVLHTAVLERKPMLINVAIDPTAGVESGTVHAFNAPKK